MVTTITLQKEDLISIKEMLLEGFNEFEKFIKNPDPETKDQILDIIEEQKGIIEGFTEVDKISIICEKKMIKEKK